MPTATARFKETIGFGPSREQDVVEREDLRPVGVLGASRLGVDGGDRRLQLVRADGAGRQRGGDERQPLGDLVRVPERAVLLLERHEPGRPEARRTAGVGQEHQRQQARDLVVVGQQPAQHPRQPDRLARELDARQRLARGRRVALVEEQVEDLQDDVEALERSRERRVRAPAPSRARCAAPSWPRRRGTPTRSRPSSDPPTARRVSASCDGGESDGWQQRNSSVSVSSRSLPSSRNASGSATSDSRRRRAASLRATSTRRRDATVISQPEGDAGRPSRGHWTEAASSASCTASSHSSNVARPLRRTSAERTRGAASRSAASTEPGEAARVAHRPSSADPIDARAPPSPSARCPARPPRSRPPVPRWRRRRSRSRRTAPWPPRTARRWWRRPRRSPARSCPLDGGASPSPPTSSPDARSCASTSSTRP